MRSLHLILLILAIFRSVELQDRTCDDLIHSCQLTSGVFMLQPANTGNPNEMEFSYKISHKHSSEYGCSQSLFTGMYIHWVSEHGWNGDDAKLSLSCSDFSSEKWEYAEGRFIFQYWDQQLTFMSSNIIFGPHRLFDWLFVKSSMLPRNNTGKPNSTPRPVAAPVYRLQANCNHTIDFSVEDPDGDNVRCRWPSDRNGWDDPDRDIYMEFDENQADLCILCNRLPGVVLDSNTCKIKYEAIHGNGYKSFAIIVEDFAPFDTKPLSSLSLLFLIDVFESNLTCGHKPEFVYPTITGGQCVAIPSGSIFLQPLMAFAGSSEASITEIQTTSVPGLNESFLEKVGDNYFINITWIPTPAQENEVHKFCYTALNSETLASDQVCIELVPGLNPPNVVASSNTPNEALVFPLNTTWKIDFDVDILRPTLTAFIRFIDVEKDNIVYSIDTSNSSEFNIENSRIAIISPLYEFEQKKDFFILLDRGVVTGTESCKPGNEMIDEPNFWTFRTKDITLPLLMFVDAATRTNQNMTMTWVTNEISTESCELLSLDFPDSKTTIQENCTSKTWSGFNVQEGNYELQIICTDTASNQAAFKHSFYVDITGPTVQFQNLNGETISNLGTPKLTNKKYATIRYRCWNSIAMRTESCTFECLFVTEDETTSEYIPCPNNNVYYLSGSLAQIDNYAFNLSVIAVDDVGNRGDPVTFRWKTDFQKPKITGNTSEVVSCDSSLAPEILGYPFVQDDQDPSPNLHYYDNNDGCTLTRTWTAIDHAGNSETFVQEYILTFEMSVSSVDIISGSCDSTSSEMTVPQSTATVPNPCSRPIQLTHTDDPDVYGCPGTFKRQWTAIDQCSEVNVTSAQTLVFYDVCPIVACGRNFTQPHGICTLGRCICNKPWYGENCDTLIYEPKIEQILYVTIKEGDNYEQEFTLLQGTPPISWALSTGPKKTKIDGVTGEIRLFRPQAGNYSISMEASNQVGQYIMAWTLIVRPTYKVYLNPIDTTVYSSAIPLVLSGYVEYEAGSVIDIKLNGNVPVQIVVYRGGSKRTLKATTLNDGKFGVAFYPTKGEYGIYTAYGKHPGEEKGTSSVEWKVMGMKLKTNYVTLSGASIDSFSKTYLKVNQIFNDGPLEMQDITVESNLGSLADNIDIDIRMNGSKTISSFPPSAWVGVDISINVTKPFQARLVIAFASSQGTRVYCTIKIIVNPILPSLNINPSSVDTRLVKGSSKVFQFKITNTGQATAHSVHGLVPDTDFMSLISFTKSDGTRQIFDLDSGEYVSMDVLIQIPENQNLGYISASVSVSSQEAYKIIPMKILVSSDVNMNLTVTVEDEYTYFAEGKPLLDTATIRLTNNQRGMRMIQSTAEGNGKVTFQNIPEDRYELFAEAPNHQKVSQVIITSAAESDLTIFLERSAVTYSWAVKPVQFTETYTVKLEADFETHVPMPVITVEPREIPLEQLEDGFLDQIEFTITNHGLIRAENVEIGVPTSHPFLEFTYSGGYIGHVDALSSVTLTVDVSRKVREKRIAPLVVAAMYVIKVAYQIFCTDWLDRMVSIILKLLEYIPVGPIVIIDDIPPPRFDDGCLFCDSAGGDFTGNLPVTDLINLDFNVQIYTAETPSFCNPCIGSIIDCFPVPSLPSFEPCVPNINPKTFPFDVHEVMDFLACMPGGQFLDAFNCGFGIGANCINPLIYGERKKRDVNELASDVFTSLHPIHLSLAMAIELFGDELWLQSGDAIWVNNLLKPIFDDSSDSGTLISANEMQAILNADPPNGATVNDTKLLLERINNTLYNWNNGNLEPAGNSNMASLGIFKNYSSEINKFDSWAKDRGFISYIDAYKTFANEMNKLETWEEEAGVCAVVRIRIEQQIALTRDAFEGTLEIENKEDFALTKINVVILITDGETGENSTHKFSIGSPETEGSLTGVQGGGSLSAAGIGSAVWLIAPYSEAAPIEDKRYNVGGKLQYTLDGDLITVPLLPASITVKPNPSLLIHYFWEKYVVGDDPFTEEVEPPEPYSLGIAVKNNGSGIAKNMHISSGQPEIVENEKGLAVKFEIIGSEVGAEPGTSSLNVEFGDISPHSTRIARWWMVSTLQGIFKNYSATFEYTNPLGDPKLSVLDELEIHDLIRNVRIYDEDDGILDFLVNDKSDVFDTPDILYNSINLQTYPVFNGTVIAMKRQTIGGTTYIKLTGTNVENGWVFFRIEITNNKEWFGDTNGLGSFFVINQEGLIKERPPENKWIVTSRKKSGVKYFLNFLDFLNANGTSQTNFLIELCSNCNTSSEVKVPPPFIPPTFSFPPPEESVTYSTPIMTTAKNEDPTTSTIPVTSSQPVSEDTPTDKPISFKTTAEDEDPTTSTFSVTSSQTMIDDTPTDKPISFKTTAKDEDPTTSTFSVTSHTSEYEETSTTKPVTSAMDDKPATPKPKLSIIKARIGNNIANTEQTCHSRKGKCMDIRIIHP